MSFEGSGVPKPETGDEMLGDGMIRELFKELEETAITHEEAKRMISLARFNLRFGLAMNVASEFPNRMTPEAAEAMLGRFEEGASVFLSTLPE